MTLSHLQHSSIRSHSVSEISLTWPKLALTLCFALLVSACGGGGGGDGRADPINISTSTAWQAGVFKPQSDFANKCAVPRTGIDPRNNKPFTDIQGTLLDEKNFLRSWSNDTYLWYSEIPDVNPGSNVSAVSYFELLKTSAKTSSGNNKDNFHFTYDSSVWYSLSETGVSAGYGMELSWIRTTPPRSVVVAYVEPGSPAALKNIKRGAQLISIDGYDFVNGNTQEIVSKLNERIFPSSLNQSYEFEIKNVGASATEKVVLTSANVIKTPVQNVKTIDTANGKVGYFVFNDHIKTAERGLYDAINQLSAQGINDLILDVRYNGGGYLYIASELSYMIAGNKIKSGAIFEKTMFNDKHSTVGLFGETLEPTPFYKGSSEIGGALPTLNLSRVFMITSGDTCSASESIINGLRGVGVEVIQIGSKTCGKPYGFYPQDNCGTTYFTIQFKGVNDKGFGEYSDGFIPSAIDNGKDLVKGCLLGDDLTRALGDESEKNLSAALYYKVNNSCPVITANSSSGKLQKTSVPDDELSNVTGSLNKPFGLTDRIMK